MANIPGQILFQTNNDAWFTTNAAIVFDDGEIIYHEDGRYKLADGVTALSALTFRGAGGTATWGGITGTLSNQTDLQTALNNKEPLKGSDDNYVTDAQLVVIGNTSGTNTGDNAANTTSNAYADGKVADSITDGVTTVAPSQNAVFDALSVRSLTILKTTTTISHTGNTTNTLVYSGLIAGNTFAIGDYITLKANGRKSFANGTCTFRLYINTSPTLSGATLLATRATTSTTHSNSGISRILIIKSASSTETSSATTNLETQYENSGISFLNIDWTIDQYLIFAVQLTNGADVGDIGSLLLQKS